MTHPPPSECRFSSDVQTWDAFCDESEARITLKLVIRKHENSPLQTGQPAAFQIMPSQSRRHSFGVRRLSIKRHPTGKTCLEFFDWVFMRS